MNLILTLMYTLHMVHNRLACSHVWHLCICYVMLLRMVPWCRRNQCQVSGARRWQLTSNWVSTANCLRATDTNVQAVTSLAVDIQTPFFLQWDTSLGVTGTNVWMSVVPTGGLMCTIGYTSANHLPCTYQPEWSSWCQSVCYFSSRNSFIFWWCYIGFKVMVNVAKTLICYKLTQLPILMNNCSRERRLSNNTTANSPAMHSNGTWATMTFLMILRLVNQFNQPSCNFWYLTLYCWPSIVLKLGYHYILISLKQWNILIECITITNYKYNRKAWKYSCTISYACCQVSPPFVHHTQHCSKLCFLLQLYAANFRKVTVFIKELHGGTQRHKLQTTWDTTVTVLTVKYCAQPYKWYMEVEFYC